MKVFILILLISYILSLYSSNSTTSKQLLNLSLYDSMKYYGNNPSLSILDISGFENDIIYISYYIERKSFNTETLNYAFTDVYPDKYFECASQTQKSYAISIFKSKRTKRSSRKTTTSKPSKKLYYEIKKQNKKYLVLENLLYQGYYIKVTHHKYHPKTWTIILLIIFFIFWIGVGSFALYIYCKNKKRTKSADIDFKKEEPSPLYPPNQTDDSTQANTIPMQQQPIPPEEANSNDTGYSSGMGQQDGYSSGMGEQGYYSGTAVPSS